MKLYIWDIWVYSFLSRLFKRGVGFTIPPLHIYDKGLIFLREAFLIHVYRVMFRCHDDMKDHKESFLDFGRIRRDILEGRTRKELVYI